ADGGDQQGEEGRLDEADPPAPERDGLLDAVQELLQRDIQQGVGQQRRAAQAKEIGQYRQQGQGNDESQDPGHHQHRIRIEANGAHGIYFLIDFHHAQLGGKGTAGAAGDHDGGQQYAHFPQHGDGDQINGKDVGAEAL